MLKIKKRGKFARFSGATAKYHPEGKDGLVEAGYHSLSRQTISTGRGPDSQKMAEYYQRIHSYDEALPDTIGLTEPLKEMKRFELTKRYAEFIKGVPRELHINFLNDESARLDLFFSGTQFFWVEVDYRRKTWRRSAVYSSKTMAVTLMEQSLLTWVETL